MKRLFIVGVGRSGTSLLQSMISAHSQVIMMPETSFLRRYLVQPRYKKTMPSHIGNKELLSDKYLQRWLDDGVVGDKLFTKDKKIPVGVFYENVVNYYASKFNSEAVEYVAEKDPKMVEVLPLLGKVVDEYLVLHIIRDPRDVVLSKNKAAWSMRQSLVKKIIANVSQILIARKFKNKNPHCIYELRYEDLLESPSQVLRGVCDFLQLPYEAGMLEFQNEAARLIAKDELSWKKETLGPLLTSNVNKWQVEMSDMECALIEKCCNQVMFSGNYLKSESRLMLWQKIKILLAYFVIMPISFLYALHQTYLKKARKG